MTTEIGTEAIQNTTITPDDFYKEVETEKQVVPENQIPEPPKTDDLKAADKAVEEKPAETKTETPNPSDIKLVAPENYLLDKTRIGEIEAFAKEHKISQDIATKILAKENEAVAGYVQKTYQDHEKQVSQWMEDVKADKEIGGEKLNESVVLAKNVLDKYGTPALIKELNETGYGNHPELVRLLSKIGRASGNDQLINPHAKAAKSSKSLEDIFYGQNKE